MTAPSRMPKPEHLRRKRRDGFGTIVPTRRKRGPGFRAYYNQVALGTYDSEADAEQVIAAARARHLEYHHIHLNDLDDLLLDLKRRPQWWRDIDGRWERHAVLMGWKI